MTTSVAVRLEPLSDDRFESWAEVSRAGFVEQQVASGSMPEPEASEYAAREFAKLLPLGPSTPGHHLWLAYDGETEVGYLWMALRQQSTGLDAYVYDVAVAEQVRGRGYGDAVMAAGESQARGLGAGCVRLNVFGHNAAALELYRRRGYEPVSTAMMRRLDTTPALQLDEGPTVRLVPMTPTAFDAYRAQAEQDYARSISSSGVLPEEEARQKSAEDYAGLLPFGLATPDHFFWTAYDGETEVGMVWLRISHESDGLHAFGFDFAVVAELRRHGYGRAIIVAAERICRERDVVATGLNVFGGNDGARALYDEMGFEVTAQLMRKPL